MYKRVTQSQEAMARPWKRPRYVKRVAKPLWKRRRVTYKRKPLKKTSKATRIKACGVTPDRSIPIKRYEIHADNNKQNYATRVLNQANLVFIPLQGSTDEIDKRDGSRVTVAGVRLNWFWRVPFGRTIPLWCNIAIVIPRNALTVETTGLFRSYEDTREQDFNVAQSWWRFNFPINKDRYEVIMHKRFLLNHNSGYNANVLDTLPNTNSLKQMNIYQKINRQFTFDDAVGGEPRQAAPIVIYWFDALAAAASSASVADVVELTRSTVVYYKED